mmetsp:Transcript_95360/g.164509  ORF Transcript_95360/g.164509 Transcript_95360/m.164509 type:complete len:101 (+) Transcript_95360:5441-5743(+)
MEVSSGEFPSQPDISVAHSAMHSAASILQLHDGTHYNPPGDCCAAVALASGTAVRLQLAHACTPTLSLPAWTSRQSAVCTCTASLCSWYAQGLVSAIPIS